MKIDFGDVFASGIGWLLKQLFLFVASIWLGTFIGGAALLAGRLAAGRGFDSDYLVQSPALLLSLWLISQRVFPGCRDLLVHS